MKSYHKLFPIIALLCLAACQVDLTVPLPEHTKRLVINSFLDQNAEPTVYLSRSFGPLEDPEKNQFDLHDGSLELLADGSSVGQLVYQDTTIEFYGIDGQLQNRRIGKYVLPNYQVEAGKLYEIRASHTGYEDVRAETQMVSAVEYSDFVLEENVKRQTDIDGYTSSQSLLKLKIQDPAGEKNYYRLFIRMKYESVWEPGFYYWEDMYGIQGPVDGVDNGGAYTATEVWLSDEGMDGQVIDASFLTYLPNAYEDQSLIQPLNIDSMYVTLLTANEDSYQYTRKLKQQREVGDFSIPIFPPESIVVYNNIENGYGIWGAMSRNKKLVLP
ncbi:MAG: DUF4249 domain-containing protein [Bacteroidota bacterium]